LSVLSWGFAVMRKTKVPTALLAVLVAFPLARVASAQVTSATIVGTITDSSGTTTGCTRA
jgi:hypothetical protein